MEQADAMMITSLKEYINLPDQITLLKDIKTEHIYLITCAIFELLKIDYTQLKQISKAQRFRSMTKLTQSINQQLDTTFDLNDIMNPTLPFLRKLVLGFVSKLGAAEGERNKAILNKGGQRNQNNYQRQILKKWVNTEFVCPQLRLSKKVKYQPHLLKFEFRKDLFKRDLTSQVMSVPGNSNAILRNTIMKDTIERKKRQAQEGFAKKKQQEGQINANKIFKNNLQDWQKAEALVKKLKKQIKKNDQNQNQAEETTQVMSIYQQEVERIAEQQKKLKGDDKKTESRTTEIQSLEEDMNPLEKIKRQCENTRISLQNQLDQILNGISAFKESIEEKQILRQKLQQQIILYQQRATAQRQARPTIKKQAEKQKIILDTIQGGNDVGKEVQELENEIRFLEKEAQKQIAILEKEISNTKKEGEEKLQILKDLKLRLTKIQADYGKVCEQIEDKTAIKSKVKITQSGISRIYYNKKISEMEARWRQTQKQNKKIIQNIKKIKEEIKRSIHFAQIGQTQIDNLINNSKLRSQNDNNVFKDMFTNCKKCFNHTIKCIEQINETKAEIQDYEIKVHSLVGKDYKENMKKIKYALEEFKKEMRDAISKK